MIFFGRIYVEVDNQNSLDLLNFVLFSFCQEAKGRKSAPANKVKRPLSGFGTFLSKEYPAEKVKDGSSKSHWLYSGHKNS